MAVHRSLTLSNPNSKKEVNERVTISVITAAYNAVGHLPKLVESLRAQTDKDFEWVVADGDSTDGTLDLLKSITDLKIIISSHPDFGLYDAINRAIKIASGEYYIVAGADDRFFPNAIKDYRIAALESAADIVTAKVSTGGGLLQVKKGKSWLYGSRAFVSAHAIGSMIRKKLHLQFGYYSKRFTISADDYFMQLACRGGAGVYIASFIAGEFTGRGVSNTDVAGTLSEGFRVQLIMEKKFPQVVIFLLRLIKNYRRI